jgi:hypothetical protein
MDDEPGGAASGEPSSQSAVVGIVIGCLAGVALLVLGATRLCKWAFRAVKIRRSVDEPLALDDQSGSAAAQERQMALKCILDRERL